MSDEHFGDRLMKVRLDCFRAEECFPQPCLAVACAKDDEKKVWLYCGTNCFEGDDFQVTSRWVVCFRFTVRVSCFSLGGDQLG